MGRLYDLIKRDYEIINEFKELEKNNYLESRKFENYDKVINAQARINRLLKYIDSKANNLYKDNNKSYEDTLKNFENIIGKDKKSLPIMDFTDETFYNCEPILNQIEKDLRDYQIDEIVEDESYNRSFDPETHVLESKLNNIRFDINNLNITENEISREDKQTLLTLFDEINSLIIAKHDENIIDKIIDPIAKARAFESEKHVEEFANKNGYNSEMLKNANDGENILDLMPKTKEQGDLLKDISNKKMDIPTSYKDKLLELDRLVNEKNLLQNIAGGESDFKEYAFNEWFDKATEIKNTVLKYSTLKFEQRNQKVDVLKEIITKGKEFREINEKYNDVIEYIKDNFDIEKISLPANIYSGRMHPTGDLKDFKPDLPSKWDYQNAPYGVILNGYGQLKAFCNNNNIQLKDFLDNPEMEYKKASLNYIKRLDQKYVLPRENNTLGKRMARILIQASGEYRGKIGQFVYSSRSLEFLWQTTDESEKTFDNYIIGNSTVNTIHMLNHSADIMFNKENDEPDYLALKTLFAKGNDVDNLFTLSNNYRDDNLNLVNNLENQYNDSIHSKANQNPLEECNRVLTTIKDFLAERKVIDENEVEIANDGAVDLDSFNPGKIFAAGREYFKDYLEKNNINVLDIPDKNDRNKILEFINDPTKAFQNKYGNDRNLFTSNMENIDTFKNQLKEELSNLYNTKKHDNFDNSFALNNQKQNGYNHGKNINTIISDNKGGFFERYIFRNTSKEYKALEKAVLAATNKDSATFGDYSSAKVYAIKYLEHKLPEGVNEANVSATGKRRIEFCRSFLKTLGALPPKYEEEGLINDIENKPLIPNDEKVDQIKVEVAKDNENFKKDVEENFNQPENNNDIIQNDNPNKEMEL